MNAKDALVVIGDEGMPKEKESVREDWKGCKRERKGHRTSFDKNKQRDNKTPQMTKFTPLVMLVDKVLAQIKDDHHLKWPSPLHSLLDIQDKRKYCRFHKDHGPYTEDCKDLKEQIE